MHLSLQARSIRIHRDFGVWQPPYDLDFALLVRDLIRVAKSSKEAGVFLTSIKGGHPGGGARRLVNEIKRVLEGRGFDPVVSWCDQTASYVGNFVGVAEWLRRVGVTESHDTLCTMAGGRKKASR